MHPVVEGAVAMTGASESRIIRTPDQRLRVFVSSTLKELEAERVAARAAIQRLHLAPVMFELGARPHPPREVYRAYLEQSDVFVGVYWQQYGWIAPGEEVSGLEDEYRLAPHEMPKLVYVKQPAEREERLAELVAHIRDDDTTSYKPFSTAEELGELVEADLAVLLAERFDASRARGAPTDTADARADDAADHLPSPPDEVLGRETDLGTLLEWLGGDDPHRLVTLVGPGGIGKTRLAIEAARLARDRFDRVTFVALEHVREPAGVLPAVARELGVHDDIGVPTLERLATRAQGAKGPPRGGQLRAGDGRRAGRRVTARRASRCHGHGDESGQAPGARGASLRRRAAGPPDRSARGVAGRDRRRARGPAVPRPSARRRLEVRPDGRERRGRRGHLPVARRRAARDRARGRVHPGAHPVGHARETRPGALPSW